MADRQRDQLISLFRDAVASESRAAANRGPDHVTAEEAEANARLRERLTAVETELKIHCWIFGLLVALALALLRFWPRQ